MDIHPVNHAKGDTNRYCGPSAISIVTRMATGEAARLLRAVSGKASIKGTTDRQMRDALAECGITMLRVIIKPAKPKRMRDPHGVGPGYTETRPTVTQWLRDSVSIRTSGRVFLISAGHHWQIISGRRFCCGRTKEIVSIKDKRSNRRARVKAVYELTPSKNGITIPAVARKANAPAKRDAKDYQLFRAMCKRNNLTYDKSSDGYIDMKATIGQDDFPDGISFLFEGWDDAVSMLEIALNDPTEVIDGYLSH